MRKIKGFTLLEVTMAMIIMSIIIMATLPLMTVRKGALGTERNTQACVKSNDVNSTSCNTFVTLCKSSSTNNSCKNMITYSLFGYDRETSTQQTFAKTVLTRACIEGAGTACDFFINACITDSNKCTTYLGPFLNAFNTDTSLGNLYIAKTVRMFYNDNIANIMTAVNGRCGNCMLNRIACNARGYGTGSCTCGSAPGTVMTDGTIKVGFFNGYNLCTTDVDQGANSWNNKTSTFTTAGTSNTRDGYLNTKTILGLNDNAVPYYAALTCQGVTAGGHTDWYLPAKDELALMNTNRNSIGGFNVAANYWSSTEASSNTMATYLNFNSTFNNAFKNTFTYQIRCVRRDY